MQSEKYEVEWEYAYFTLYIFHFALIEGMARD